MLLHELMKVYKSVTNLNHQSCVLDYETPFFDPNKILAWLEPRKWHVSHHNFVHQGTAYLLWQFLRLGFLLPFAISLVFL